MNLKRLGRPLVVVIGLAVLVFVGGLVMSDFTAHMYWMKAHRILLDQHEPDETDRETRLRDARTMLTKALAISPTHAEMWFDLGRVADGLREIEQERADDQEKLREVADLSEKSYARAAALCTQHPRYRLALAWSSAANQLFVKRRLRDGDFHKLETLFTAAEELAPHDPKIQFSCASFWLMSERMFDRETRPRAIDAFARCIAADPDRWVPAVREKFAADPPSVEEMYRLVGPRRHLIRQIHADTGGAVTKLRRDVVAVNAAAR